MFLKERRIWGSEVNLLARDLQTEVLDKLSVN